MKYKCNYPDGGGGQHDCGIWEMKETKKTKRMILKVKPFFDVVWDELIFYKEHQEKNHHPWKEYDDGSIVIYPYQCGIPYCFEQIID